MAPQRSTESRTHNEYTVGWVCALPKERTAAIAMLDHIHADLPKPSNDHNTYTLGSIGGHNVVIACLPKGTTASNLAATVTAWMVTTFPSIKIGLMVGIGGGIPPKVRLGDVVVSTPVGQFPGVVQWDIGKAEDGGNFERTGALNRPPTLLLTALTKLETEHDLREPKIPKYLKELKQKWPKLVQRYLKSDSLEDVLFRADYSHIKERIVSSEVILEVDDKGEAEEEESCRFCDRTKVVKRKPRDMRVHYGLIASGNRVIKDASLRDKLNKHLGGHVLCVDMEAAGLMGSFPCIVIRGICDYADSHKNKAWQEYAATVAAALAKELLEYVQPSDVQEERPVKDILDQIHHNTSKVEAHIGKIRLKLDNDNDMNILDWLTPIDYGPQQTDYIKRREPGTGQWFVESKEFKTWLNNSNKTLFCPGIPGAGKTILTSLVVKELTASFGDNNDVGIAYLYCNFRRQHEQKVEDLLLSLLKQLSQSQLSLPESVKALYNSHESKRTRPLLDEIVKALQSVSTFYVRVFLIIDALDECEISDNSRTRLLSTIFELQSKRGANIFATSRINDEIEKHFAGTLTLKIHADSNDIKSYVEAQVVHLQSDVFDHDIQEMIVSAIAKAVDGMFLVAELHMKALAHLPTRGHIKQALHNLAKGPIGLDKIYEEAIERIDEYGKQIVAWIVHAQRPLSTTELQHALAVRPDTTELDEEFLPSVQVLRSRCAGLVTVDDESDIIRLVHYTAQEYFEKTRDHWFPNAETKITETCVTYLSFDVFKGGFCETDGEFETLIQSNKLYDYAAHQWGHHARKASISYQGVIKFLEKQAQVEASSQALMAVKKWPEHENYSQNVPKHMTGLHLAAYFGVYDVVKFLFSSNYTDPKDSYARTPLSWAAMYGHEATVQLLLDKGAEVDVDDSDGRTPLSYAAQYGHEAIVQLLLEKGAEVDAWDVDSRTPLSWAARRGHEATVRLLLEKGATVDAQDHDGQTPLSQAAMSGHEVIVQLLLEKGATVDAQDHYGQMPLSQAARRGHEAIVQLLLEKGAMVNTQDHYGQTPLWQATMRGHEATVQLLLEKGAEVDAQDRSGQTLLSWAAMRGHKATVQLLLEKGAEVNAWDVDGQTPLSQAARRGHEAAVRLLLEKGATVDAQDPDGQTPLSRAAMSGHEATVQLLLEKGAMVNAQDHYGQTPLSWAVWGGHEVTVQLLLEKGAVVNAQDHYGQTPLSRATMRGHEAIVQLLLEKGAEVDAQDRSGQTLLSWAAMRRDEAMVQLLLKKGVEVNAKDRDGQTPLLQAARRGHEAIVQLLLEKGAAVDAKDCDGQMPLSWAAVRGHEATVQLLLDKGAAVDAEDGIGWTPLLYAAKNGHEATVQLLLDKGAKVDAKDRTGWTPLSQAAENGHEAIVQLLLENGDVVNAQDRSGQTPLLWAAMNGHKAIVQLLLKKGAEVDAEDSCGRTPLWHAAERWHEAKVQLLLEKGAKVDAEDDVIGWTPLSQAARSGNWSIVELLLENGAEVDAKDNHGRTPLSWATEKGGFVVVMLLDKGAEVDAQDRSGRTPLSWAAESGDAYIVELLLKNGAEVDAKDNYGRTPLSWAAENGAAESGDASIVELLLENGAEVDAKDNYGRTPLVWATENGHEYIVERLLENGAGVDARDPNGQMPLVWANENGHEYMSI